MVLLYDESEKPYWKVILSFAEHITPARLAVMRSGGFLGRVKWCCDIFEGRAGLPPLSCKIQYYYSIKTEEILMVWDGMVNGDDNFELDEIIRFYSRKRLFSKI